MNYNYWHRQIWNPNPNVNLKQKIQKNTKKYDILIKQYPEDKEKYPHKDFASKDRVVLNWKQLGLFFKKSKFSYESHRSVSILGKYGYENLSDIWGKVFKNGPSKIWGRQALKNLKWYGHVWYGLPQQTI